MISLDIVIINTTNDKIHLYYLIISKFSNKLFDLSFKTIYPPIIKNFYNKVDNI